MDNTPFSISIFDLCFKGKRHKKRRTPVCEYRRHANAWTPHKTRVRLYIDRRILQADGVQWNFGVFLYFHRLKIRNLQIVLIVQIVVNLFFCCYNPFSLFETKYTTWNRKLQVFYEKIRYTVGDFLISRKHQIKRCFRLLKAIEVFYTVG